MRVSAKVGPHELIVLIDSGSTHNFINERIVELLQLPVVPIEPFYVKVANGDPNSMVYSHQKRIIFWL